MTREEILQEIVDIDIEIESEMESIEVIYKDIKADMARREEWLNKLRDYQDEELLLEAKRLTAERN